MVSLTPTNGIKLSICIATFNRARFLRETLESLIVGLPSNCEIVVSDNASTDDTEQVVSEFSQRCDRLRFVRQERNVGLDRNFDRAVQFAQGQYCWIKSDDDLAKPGAFPRIMDALRRDWSTLVLNMELRDLTLSRVMRHRWIDIDGDRVYEPHQLDQLFIDLHYTLLNIGNIIVNRSLWLSRDRERYYDSLLIHLGVIFQRPLPGGALVIAEPLILYRLGNIQSFASTWPKILLSNWPTIIEGSGISEAARSQVKCARGQWGLMWMLFLRLNGYSVSHYRLWVHPRLTSARLRIVPFLVALLPRSIAVVTLSSHAHFAPALSDLRRAIQKRMK